MEIEQLIKARLQIVNSVEPISKVADVLFYRYIEDEAINIALIPIEGIKNITDKELVRKLIVRKLLSKSFLKSHFDNPDSISDLTFFSIDPISEIDHCYFVNPMTMQYEYCNYDFKGNVLLTRAFKISEELEEIAEIDFNLSDRDEYFPSVFIDNFYRNSINRIVLDDYRTLGYDKIYGYTISELRSDVLEFGLTEFDKPYKNLTADDKVNVYCYLNLKKHYFTTYGLFERFFSILSLGQSNTFNCIDIGCGPLTSGLALADIFQSKTGNKLSVNYYGIDSSVAMINKAESFTKLKCFSPSSSFLFDTSLENLNLKEFFKPVINSDQINIVACSYLFASETINVKFLSQQLGLLHNIKGDFYILYQNSTNESKNENWKLFKQHFDCISVYSASKTIYYHNSRSINSERKCETVRYEILKIISQDYAI